MEKKEVEEGTSLPAMGSGSFSSGEREEGGQDGGAARGRGSGRRRTERGGAAWGGGGRCDVRGSGRRRMAAASDAGLGRTTREEVGTVLGRYRPREEDDRGRFADTP